MGLNLRPPQKLKSGTGPLVRWPTGTRWTAPPRPWLSVNSPPACGSPGLYWGVGQENVTQTQHCFLSRSLKVLFLLSQEEEWGTVWHWGTALWAGPGLCRPGGRQGGWCRGGSVGKGDLGPGRPPGRRHTLGPLASLSGPVGTLPSGDPAAGDGAPSLGARCVQGRRLRPPRDRVPPTLPRLPISLSLYYGIRNHET